MFASKDTLLTRPGGYTIARSVRLRSSASAYLSRTFGAPTDRPKWTWSGWVKKAAIAKSGGQCLIQADNTTTRTDFYFTATDELRYYDTVTTAVMQTTPIYRDPSAWMHIMCVADIANATAASKMKMYVNGVEVTAFSTDQRSSMGTTGHEINKSASAHIIGGWPRLSTEFLDGYLTEINFIDGQALTPSSFGETDSITGVWKPKAYSGTYGTNGFELNFSDNSNNTAATIGKDYSGNGNNWTPNNISVTAGATYDSMTDVPTLTSATAANYCVMNPVNKSSNQPIFSNANLTVTGNAAAYNNTVSSMSMKSGKWYAEIQVVGSLISAEILGIVNASDVNYLTTNVSTAGARGYAYYIFNGNKQAYGTSTAYGAAFANGDICGIAFDADAGTLTFYKNGVSQGVAFTGIAGSEEWFFCITAYGGGPIWNANFGQRPFSYTPPTGYVALNTYNLPDSTIKNGAGYMAATLYTGTNATNAISNAVNSVSFQPDWVWVKARNFADNHGLFDSVRGANIRLISNLTNAEVTYTDTLMSFNSNGFTLGADAGGRVNGTGTTYVGWQWKAGGTSSSNTNGSITSTVSVGATQGFSVVTYTGNGTAGATVGHGLGAVPQMFIVKSRSAATSWNVYHVSTGNTGAMFLETTNAFAADSTRWNNTSPTSTVFSLGNGGGVNASAGTFVAYCFSAVAGYSAFGSYTGNGSTDGPFVYTGFRPRWIMLKRSSAAGAPWSMFDTSRNTYNSTNLELDANNSNAESTSGNGMDILSNGFKLRDSAYLNSSSGDTFIYAAFAESPFKTSLAR